MNKAEAKEILARELIHLQAQTFEELQEFIDSPKVFEREGVSGAAYQIEIQAFWDNPPASNGDLWIIASIDDGRFLSALLPLSSDFIMDPDGDIKGD